MAHKKSTNVYLGFLVIVGMGYTYMFSLWLSAFDQESITAEIFRTRRDTQMTNGFNLNAHPLLESAENVWARPSLLNLRSFHWQVPNVDTCRRYSKDAENRQIMIILILSARYNFHARNVTRRSYGSLASYKNWVVRPIFLLGQGNPNANLTQAEVDTKEKILSKERHHYGDLLIGSFIDTYYNITYKPMMGYKWVLNYCPEASFVLKTDDDVFIDILRWLDWRGSDLQKGSNGSQQAPNLYCRTFLKAPPYRNTRHKWYASKTEWSGKYYPTFCRGIAYAMTVDLIRKIYSISNGKYFRLEDVFITGMLMSDVKAKFNVEPNIRNIVKEITVKGMYQDVCGKDHKAKLNVTRKFGAVTLLEHDTNFEGDMMCLWKRVTHDNPDIPNA